MGDVAQILGRESKQQADPAELLSFRQRSVRPGKDTEAAAAKPAKQQKKKLSRELSALVGSYEMEAVPPVVSRARTAAILMLTAPLLLSSPHPCFPPVPCPSPPPFLCSCPLAPQWFCWEP